LIVYSFISAIGATVWEILPSLESLFFIDWTLVILIADVLRKRRIREIQSTESISPIPLPVLTISGTGTVMTMEEFKVQNLWAIRRSYAIQISVFVVFEWAT
jgi:hypothetical protein